MSTVLLDFTILANISVYPTPADWLSVGQTTSKISGGAWASNGSTNAILIYNKIPTGLLTSSVVLGTISASESRGIAFCDANGNGYLLLVRSTDARLFLSNAGVLGAQVGATYSGTFAIDDVVLGTLNQSTGTFVFSKNGTQFATFTNTTYSTGLRSGIHSRSITGYIKSVSVSDYSLQYVTSINSGNPITANQTTVSSVTTGFTGLPTSITCNLAGITCSSIGGTTNAPTFVKSQRVNGQPWPLNGSTATFTYVNGSETASGTQAIQKEAGDVVLTVSGGITDDPSAWTYWLTQDGFTVEGGELSYTPYGDLVLTADGGGTVTDAGMFTSWFRPATGTGAGNVYYYEFTISDGGIIQQTNKRSSIMSTNNVFNSTPITATTTIKVGQDGEIFGIFVSTATAATITISDGNGVMMPTTASLTITEPYMIHFPVAFLGGATITITGTFSGSVLWL